MAASSSTGRPASWRVPNVKGENGRLPQLAPAAVVHGGPGALSDPAAPFPLGGKGRARRGPKA